MEQTSTKTWAQRKDLHGGACEDERTGPQQDSLFRVHAVQCVLVGNVDAHSKNYSLLIPQGGNVTMAPVYDIMNGDIYENVIKNFTFGARPDFSPGKA